MNIIFRLRTANIERVFRPFLWLSVIFLIFLILSKADLVSANPEGGVVAAGNVSIANVNTPIGNRTEITQTSDKAIIDWRSFNIAPTETTNFSQPSPSAMTLNRVNGAQGASSILGNVTANGQVWLVNPAGIFFGSGSTIDVAGLVATTANISNADFMSGNYRFVQSPDWNGAVINEGTIHASDGGMVALVAPGVSNRGVIQANLGKVALASGSGFTLDFYGDNLINFAAGNTVTKRAVDRNGNELSDAVSNSGSIIADGGKVLLTAQVAKNVVDNVINTSGVIQANSVGIHNGTIVLMGGSDGLVRVTGKVVAQGTHGGKIKILGEKVGLFDNAQVLAEGDAAGGIIYIGGDEQGAGPDPNSSYSYVGPNAIINASAIHNGDGGTVVIWSDIGTQVYGTIAARGGAEGGNGGFVETSSHNFLDVLASVDTSSAAGKSGLWLLDPDSLTISTSSDFNVTSSSPFTPSPSGTSATLSTTTLASALNSGSVTVQTSSGDITLSSLFSFTSNVGDRTLTLQSGNNININANLTFTPTGGVSPAQLRLNANNNITIADSVTITTARLDTNVGGVMSELGSGKIIATDSFNAFVENHMALTGANQIAQYTVSIVGADSTDNYITDAGSAPNLIGLTQFGTGNIFFNASAGQIYIPSNGILDPTVNVLTNILYLTAATSIVEDPGNPVIRGNLVTSSGTGTTLNSTQNVLSSFGASNTTSGDISLGHNQPQSWWTNNLTITGIDQTSGNTTINNTGGIIVAGNVSSSSTTSLTASSTISQSSGVISGALVTSSSGGTALNGANTVSSFNATNASSGDVSLNNANSLVVTGSNTASGRAFSIINTAGTLSTSGSISTSGGGAITLQTAGALSFSNSITAGSSGAITLTSTGSTVTESGSGTLSGGLLTTSSVGGTTIFNSFSNAVSSFNATNSGSGNILFEGTQNLLITGINQSGGGLLDIVNNSGGSITISGNVSTGSGDISLNSQSFIQETGTASVSGHLLEAVLNGDFTFNNANAISRLNVLVFGGTGGVSFNNTASTLTIEGISPRGGDVSVNNTGDITIVGGIFGSSNNVSLTSSGSLSEDPGSAITAALLTTSSSGDTTLDATNFVSSFNAQTTATGAITLNNTASTLTITGLQTAGGAITISNSGSIAGSVALSLNAATTFTVTTANSDILLGSQLNNFSVTPIFTNNGDIRDLSYRNVNSNAGTPTLPTGLRNLTLSFDNASIALASVAQATGTMSLTSGTGSISQTSAGTITANALTTSSKTGTLLNTANNSVSSFAATNSTSGNIALTNTTSTLTLAGISETGGDISVINTGDVATSGAISGNGNITLYATGGGSQNVTISNNIVETGVASKSVTLKADNSIIFNSSADIGTTNALDIILNSDTDGSNAGDIQLNTGTVFSSAGGNITLGGGTAGTGAGNSVGNAAIWEGVKMDGAQLLAAGGNIALRGQAFIGPVGQTAGIWLVNSSQVSTTGSGTITLTGQGGSGTRGPGIIVDTGSTVSVANGLLTMSGTGGTGSGNNFGVSLGGTIQSTGSGNIIINGTGAGGALGLRSFSGGSIHGGLLTINTVNGASLTGANILSSFNATNSTSGDISLTNTGALDITGISQSVGNLTVSNAGSITQSGAIVVNGVGKTATFTETSANSDILLSNAANNISATIFTNNGNIRDLSLSNTNSSASIPTLSTGLRNLSLTFDNAAMLLPSAILTGTLNVTANGAITQSGALTVAGVSTFASGSGNDITLNSANNFSTLVITNGKNVSVTDVNALILGTSLVSGNLTVNTNGAITQSGALTVLGTSSFSAGSNAITLTNTSNNLGGLVTLSNTGANAVSVTNGNGDSLQLGGVTVGGDFTGIVGSSSANTGSLSTSSLITSGGNVTLHTLGSGAITIGSGGITSTGGSAANGSILIIADNIGAASTSITDSGVLTTQGGSGGVLTIGGGALVNVSAVLGAGNITLIGNSSTTTLNNVTFTTPTILSFPNNLIIQGAVTSTGVGSDLTISADNLLSVIAGGSISSSGNISLNGNDGISLAGPIQAVGDISLTSLSGSITQTSAGTINANTLTTYSMTGTLLANANNTVSNFNATNFGTGDIRFTNTASPLTITGITQSGSGAVVINNTGNITISGSILAGSNDVSIFSTGSISEVGSASITAGLLTTSSTGGTSLSNTNNLAYLNATNYGTGDITVNNSGSTFTVETINQLGSGNVTIVTDGDLVTQNVIRTTGGNVNMEVTDSGMMFIGSGGIETNGGDIYIIDENINALPISIFVNGNLTTGYSGQGVLTINGGAAMNAPYVNLGTGNVYINGHGTTITLSDLNVNGQTILQNANYATGNINTELLKIINDNSDLTGTVSGYSGAQGARQISVIGGAVGRDLFNGIDLFQLSSLFENPGIVFMNMLDIDTGLPIYELEARPLENGSSQRVCSAA